MVTGGGAVGSLGAGVAVTGGGAAGVDSAFAVHGINALDPSMTAMRTDARAVAKPERSADKGLSWRVRIEPRLVAAVTRCPFCAHRCFGLLTTLWRGRRESTTNLPCPDRGEVGETRVGRGMLRAPDAARGEGQKR